VWAYDGYGVSVLLAGRGGARGRGGGRRQHRRVEGLHTQTQINDVMSEGRQNNAASWPCRASHVELASSL
jgi:hypothetical protein